MYWNIDIIARSNQSSYAGGSALMVDTNEGAVAKISALSNLDWNVKKRLKKKNPLTILLHR